MVQLTFVPSLISIEAFFIVSWQFELVTGGFSMKTAIFQIMLMRERVNKTCCESPKGKPIYDFHNRVLDSEFSLAVNRMD
jgi:hypothetical protein